MCSFYQYGIFDVPILPTHLIRIFVKLLTLHLYFNKIIQHPWIEWLILNNNAYLLACLDKAKPALVLWLTALLLLDLA